jgi:hypothetical protein
MVRTRSITAPLPDLNFGSMQTLPLHNETARAAFFSSSFRDGPKDQTSDVQVHIGNLEFSGSMLRIDPE